jgi:hypothetical protein
MIYMNTRLIRLDAEAEVVRGGDTQAALFLWRLLRENVYWQRLCLRL